MYREVVRKVPLIDKMCPVCGLDFRGMATQVYCSRRCQNKADYERHAQQRRAAKRTAQ